MDYWIDLTKRVIYARLIGPVNSDSFIKYIQALRSNEHFQSGFNIIMDVREAHVPQGYTELAQVAEFVKVTSVASKTFRMSILVQNEEQIRSANLYILLVGHENVKVFQSVKKAEDWVSLVLTQPTTQQVEVNEL